MISSGRSSITLEELLSRVSEGEMAYRYLNVTRIPCVICSPLRKDERPSFGLYSSDGTRVHYKDFATGESGDLFNLLSQMWGLSLNDLIIKIAKDYSLINTKTNIVITKHIARPTNITINKSKPKIEVKVRKWQKYDIQYWKSFGISLDWLKYADVYPISHKIITKEGKRYVFGTDKYAYAYIERKEGNISIKIYQPYNTQGFKWSTSTDSSVISLWTKMPQSGDKICICSSLKDALCLWANIGVPAIAPQGEGYNMSITAINELKKRFKEVYILYDNDPAGITDSTKLAESTGFKLLILPDCGAKDISDLYKSLGNKQQFQQILNPLFN